MVRIIGTKINEIKYMRIETRRSVFICIALTRSTVKNNIRPYTAPEAPIPTKQSKIDNLIGLSKRSGQSEFIHLNYTYILFYFLP